jgi:hypothetical protein
MYTIKIPDGSTNSLLNIHVKCTIYKGEHNIYIYPFECIETFMLWRSTKKDKHKLETATTALLLSNGNSVLSVEGFCRVACYSNLSVILGFPVDNKFQTLILNITLEHFPDFMNCNIWI